jgi:hypothetical protein
MKNVWRSVSEAGFLLTFLLVLANASEMQAQNIGSNPASPTISADSEKATFQWKSALVDASLFLGVEHTFRLTTDPKMRDGLRGPFFRDYADSVRAIHGWSDGDSFAVAYIAHPAQGAVTGFIEIHNDSRYRAVEVGASPQYWKSRLRAMAFTAAYSLQLEIGPVSEASIGNSQLVCPHCGGVIDWVITPTVGTALLVGEDLTDKYLIRTVERHTRNVALMAMARTFLNPCRGFSNIMGRRAPWHRDDRPGIIPLSKEP